MVGAYYLASPESSEYRTYWLCVRKPVHDKKRGLHLLRILKIVFVLLLQGGVQSILGAEVRYSTRDTLTGTVVRQNLGA